MTIGEQIRRARENNNLSQEDLTEQLGVSRQAVSKWENDTSVLQGINRELLSKLLELELELGTSANTTEDKPVGKSKVIMWFGWGVAAALIAVLGVSLWFNFRTPLADEWHDVRSNPAVKSVQFYYDSRYIEDKALLQPVTIRYVPDLAQQIYGCIGEDIAYVGYPSENREGSCICVYGMSFALSAGSDKLDGAWEFVRTYLTEDFQRDGLYGVNGSSLPIRWDIFAERAQIAVTQEGYCFINGDFFPVSPMTQEQIDMAVDFIKGLHNMAFEDEVNMNIIYEEVESFFHGQRPAEDVAGLIQNGVIIGLNGPIFTPFSCR